MAETKSEDFTKLSMLHLGLEKARQMWYLGDITTLNEEINKSAKNIVKKQVEKNEVIKDPLKLKIKEVGELEGSRSVWKGRRAFNKAMQTVLEKDANWDSLSTLKNFQKMVESDKEMKNEKSIRVFYVPIDSNQSFYKLVGNKINAQSILTLYFDDEVYQRDGEKGLRKVLILKDIFNISGLDGKRQFRGAKFFFQKAMDIVISDYKENGLGTVTQVATSPFQGETGDGQIATVLKNRRASFTRWGFNHIKSEPEYYGLQKFQSIPEYGLPVQTSAAQARKDPNKWGLIDYNFENVTRVKASPGGYKIGDKNYTEKKRQGPPNTYNIGGETFGDGKGDTTDAKTYKNIMDALQYEKYTVSLFSKTSKLENSSGFDDDDEHMAFVTSTIRHLDWFHSLTHTENRKITFEKTKPYQGNEWDLFISNPAVSDIEEIRKEHYYKKKLYDQFKNKKPTNNGRVKFFFERYLNYIFEIPLKQSYEEWLPNGEKLSAKSYETYKNEVLYVSFQALQFFEKFDNTITYGQIDTNEFKEAMKNILKIPQNSFAEIGKNDKNKDNQLNIGEFERWYQKAKFKKLLNTSKKK